MKLRLARAALEVIRGEAARAYPHEACGGLTFAEVALSLVEAR